MKHIVRKAYWDYEKEEIWINHMSDMGLALVDYSWCRYVFEKARPNEYVYKLELLEKHTSDPGSVTYLQFLEENGIECVAKYMR